MGAIGGKAATVVCLAAKHINEHISMADQDIVAMVPITRPEQAANLRLIAAAPELLAALQAITSGLSDAEDAHTFMRAGEVKQARIAIAKATGEK